MEHVKITESSRVRVFAMNRTVGTDTVKIVGGEEAIANSIPWQISLRYKKELQGRFVTPWLLTGYYFLSPVATFYYRNFIFWS